MTNSIKAVVLAGVMILAGMGAAQAQLMDPNTGMIVNATSDPVDWGAIAGGQPTNPAMELNAAAMDRMAAASAVESAAQDAQNRQNFADFVRAAQKGNDDSAPVLPATAKAVISPRGGTFHAAQLPVMVTLADPDTKAVLHYTTDGSKPTEKSAVYAGAIAVSGKETIKVLAV